MGAPHFREGRTEAQPVRRTKRSRALDPLNPSKEFRASWKNRAKGKKIEVRRSRGCSEFPRSPFLPPGSGPAGSSQVRHR